MPPAPTETPGRLTRPLQPSGFEALGGLKLKGLPDAAALAPYLGEIDANRYYSNYGPLVRRFQERLTAATRFVGGDGTYQREHNSANDGAVEREDDHARPVARPHPV
jgi:hypothetical protein